MTVCENSSYGLLKVGEILEEGKFPTNTPVPVISVAIKASVVHAIAQVEVTQVYINHEDQPIEAIYYFPVNPDGAVTHFQAEFQGRIIRGTVKPHEEAKAEYEEAISKRTTAFLGDETKADIFKIHVGYLKPGEQVKVVIGYVTEVKNEPGSNAIRFYIPTTVAPRYVSPTETDAKAEDIKGMEYSVGSPAPLSIKVAVFLQGKIKSVSSPTHPIKVDITGKLAPKQLWEKAAVELGGEATDMDRDFVLTILPEEIHQPRLYAEVAGPCSQNMRASYSFFKEKTIKVMTENQGNDSKKIMPVNL